jgi:hypothetical protein
MRNRGYQLIPSRPRLPRLPDARPGAPGPVAALGFSSGALAGADRSGMTIDS